MHRSTKILCLVLPYSVGCGDGNAGGSTSAETTTDTDGVVGDSQSSTSEQDTEDSQTMGIDESTTGDDPELPQGEGPSLALGDTMTCQVLADGSRRCWGASGCGFGDGSYWSRAVDTIEPPGSWRSMDLGRDHGCAIDDEGGLWCFGTRLEGRVGDGIVADVLDAERCAQMAVPIAEGTRWTQVAAGDRSTCGIQDDGTLWCWGDNEFGQVGDGSVGRLYTRYAPVRLPGTEWEEVMVGDMHACGRTGDGEVLCWGSGAFLGRGQDVFSAEPVPVMGPRFSRLARGGISIHTCAVSEDDAVWCWGRGDLGALGTGDESHALVPTRVALEGPFVALSVGGRNTCAVAEGGRLWCWGSNTFGQLAGETDDLFSPRPIEIESETPWVDVRVGPRHICGVLADDRVVCWGNNRSGQVGDGTSGPDNTPREPSEVTDRPMGEPWPGFVEVSTGSISTCARRDDGSIWCWGDRAGGHLGDGPVTPKCDASQPSSCEISTTPVMPSGGRSWRTVASGRYRTCGIDETAGLHCWGGEQLVPTPMPGQDWQSISSGYGHMCGLQAPGSLWCWGANTWGQLGTGEQGDGTDGPVQVGDGEDWDMVSAGERHTCGIRAGGELFCWGGNSVGQVGSGTSSEEVSMPTSVPGTWLSVSAGGAHSCAVAQAGTLWCWGSNRSGAVGQGPAGERQTRPSPVQVGDSSRWIDVAAGSGLTCGRRDDGTLWCWGDNTWGAVGIGDFDPMVSVSAPRQVGADADWSSVSANGHICGLRDDRTLWCWGQNRYGQLGLKHTFPSAAPAEVRR